MAGQMDPQMAQFIQAETQKQQAAELVSVMTDQCWETCMGYPGQKLDRKTETCFVNCVERLMDTSKFIMGRIGQTVNSSMKSSSASELSTNAPIGQSSGSRSFGSFFDKQ